MKVDFESLRYQDPYEDPHESTDGPPKRIRHNQDNESFKHGTPFRKSDLDKLPEDALPNYSIRYLLDGCEGCRDRRTCSFHDLQCEFEWDREETRSILGDDECYACTKVFYEYGKCWRDGMDDSDDEGAGKSYYAWYDKDLKPIMQSGTLFTIRQFIHLMNGVEVVMDPPDYLDVFITARSLVKLDSIKSSCPDHPYDNVVFKAVDVKVHIHQDLGHNCHMNDLVFESLTAEEYVALLLTLPTSWAYYSWPSIGPSEYPIIHHIIIKDVSNLMDYELEIGDDVFIFNHPNSSEHGRRIDYYSKRYDWVISCPTWRRLFDAYNYLSEWTSVVCEKLCMTQHLDVGAGSYFHYLGVCLYDIAKLLDDDCPRRYGHPSLFDCIPKAMGLI